MISEQKEGFNRGVLLRKTHMVKGLITRKGGAERSGAGQEVEIKYR